MTTISDTFTRANSTSTLGSTESPVVAWTADNGTWGINTNQAYVVTQAGFDSRATIPVGQANMDVSAAITTAQDAGVMASYVDSGNYYLAKIISSAVTVIRRQGGTDNTLTSGAGSWSDGATLRLVTNDSGSGTQVTAYIGATQVYTNLDTTAGRPAGTRAGLRDGTGGSPGSPRFDNFSVVYTVPTGPVDTRPASNVRAEVAFTTSPDDPAPAWRDMTSRLDIVAGIGITRGRQDEYGAVTPGRCSLTLDNTDGELTAGRASSSLYPYVKPSRRMRVTYRLPTVAGNMLSANAASMETSIADWATTSAFGYIAGVTLASSTTHAADGTKALLVTWPTTGAGNTAIAYTPVSCVIGRTYIASMSVWVPAGNNPVRCDVMLTAVSSASTVTGAFQRLSVTFTATQSTHYVGVSTVGSTSGHQVWVDAVMVDEGTTLNTFTTTAPAIEYRYDGYLEDLPTEWPGGNKYTQVRWTAVDLLARLGTKRKLRSVVEETILDWGPPAAYYPLGEPEGSTTASDVTGTNTALLSTKAAGAGGGSLTFGTGTGPPTDGLTAPQFTPVSGSNGLYLVSDQLTNGVGGINSLTLTATFLYAAPGVPWAGLSIATLMDGYGFFVRLYINGTDNKLYAQLFDPWANANWFSLASTTTFNDGNTHTVAVTIDLAGNSVKLLEGSTQLATVSFGGRTSMPLFTTLAVGGLPPGGSRTDGGLFSGTISHVAAYSWALDPSGIGQIQSSATTGFAGERSDQRIARIAGWVGLDPSRQVLDTGMSTSIAHVDPTGKKPLDYMQQIADTEGGVLFADRQGRLVFYSRARSYTAQTVIASVDANDVSADVTPRESKQELVNDMTGKRTDGGPEIRYTDTASAAEHGYYEDSLELAVTSDDEVLSAIQWRVNAHAQPTVRIPDVDIDAMTNTAIQSQVRAIDVWSRVQVTSTPSQSPSSTWDLTAQGYTESIALSGWRVSVNATTVSRIQGLILDDATLGKLDSTNVLVY